MGENNPTNERKYRIICLKRSKFEHYYPSQHYVSDWYSTARFVYWMPNGCGYTKNVNEAGHYTLQELGNCAGSHGDWLVEPVWC